MGEPEERQLIGRPEWDEEGNIFHTTPDGRRAYLVGSVGPEPYELQERWQELEDQKKQLGESLAAIRSEQQEIDNKMAVMSLGCHESRRTYGRGEVPSESKRSEER